MSAITNCRLCRSKNLKNLFSLGNQSFTGIFPKNKNQTVPKGNLSLLICNKCKLVQLKNNFNPKVMYGRNYGYRSGLNASMVNHIKNKVVFLKKKVKLEKDDRIIDIGSNDGTLLNFFKPNKYKLIAVDPTIKKYKKFYKKNIIKISDFFSYKKLEKHLIKKKAKLITSIAMFYDLPDPVYFAKQVYDSLEDNGIWHLEQSYSGSMLHTLSYDTICHEHLEYYSLYSIKKIFDKSGFKIIDINFNDINGGSFAITVSKKISKYIETKKISKILKLENKKGINNYQTYKIFYKKIKKQKEKILNFFKKIKEKKQTVIGYGASTKGNVLLQFCRLNSTHLKFICDVNPDKYGSYTPGTKIKIISEKEGKKIDPDYFFVLPWHFRKFIMKKESNLRNKGKKLIFPLPNFEVI
jgi:hypothetical protein